MSDNKCKWTPEYPLKYECTEVFLVNDHNFHCILHSVIKNKDAKVFRQKVEERINTKNDVVDLTGCCFPKGFEREFFQKRSFNKPVDFRWTEFSQNASFLGTEFLKRVDFSQAKFS